MRDWVFLVWVVVIALVTVLKVEAISLGGVVNTITGIFDNNGNSSNTSSSSSSRTSDGLSPTSYGPAVTRTIDALRQITSAAAPPPSGAQPPPPVASASGEGPPLPEPQRTNVTMRYISYGPNSYAVIQKDGPRSVYISFQDKDLGNSTASWTTSQRVSFLKDFVYTAEAPSRVLLVFDSFAGNASRSPGTLMSGIRDVMAGNSLLWVTCAGQGPGGGLAILCGLKTALHFPKATVDVITFGTPWIGFNPQFAWSFDRLINLYYFWPFTLPQLNPQDPNIAVALSNNTNNSTAADQAASTVESFITQAGVLKQATTLPNLPPTFPPSAKKLPSTNVTEPSGSYEDRKNACYASYANQTYGYTPTCLAGSPTIKNLGVLGPAAPTNLPPPGQLPPSSPCPPIICKTRHVLDMSCTGFKSPSPASLAGINYTMIHDKKSGADVIVAWNDTRKAAYFLWQYTSGLRDWYTDIKAIPSDDFIGRIKQDFPLAITTTKAFGNVRVHSGFYDQFKSLAITGENAFNLTLALYNLSNGQIPEYIVCSGFSLGGALAELSAVWSSYKWPRARILVATQGAPKVGNSEYVDMYKGTVGMSYRYQFNLDQVPSLPPILDYTVTRAPIWIASENNSPWYVLLQYRPEISLSVSTWYDHWCEVFYVPILLNATNLSVPSWIYDAGSA